MRSALVFGGSGQIGVPVVERLLANGWQVHAVSRTVQEDRDRLNWLIGDLHQVHGLPSRVDAIFSLGPLDLFSHWYASTRMPASRVVAFGSTSLETKQESADAYERELAGRLRDAEIRVFATAKQLQSKATLLRPTLVYGAGRDRTLTRIAMLARRTGFFVLPRDANGLRQPVHVDDLADAVLAVVEADATEGRGYALPGGETLGYAQMVERTLVSLQPPARLICVPAPLFKAALSGAKLFGRMQGMNEAAVARMREDLVFDAEPARRDFGYAPRAFNPTAAMFSF
ncbi:MAG TPA: NAD-dependent epimerase/dehydratase family protein [Pseudoxanthomonas sp.]